MQGHGHAVKAGANKFFVDEDIFIQTLDVITTRSKPLGIELVIGKYNEAVFNEMILRRICSVPSCIRSDKGLQNLLRRLMHAGSLVGVAADLMSLTLLTPPGEWGADIVRFKSAIWPADELWRSACRLFCNKG